MLEPMPKAWKLTRFLSQELLFDYVSGRLSPVRQRALVEHIESCRETQRELARLERGLAYARRLAELEPDPQLLARLNRASPWRSRRQRALTGLARRIRRSPVESVWTWASVAVFVCLSLAGYYFARLAPNEAFFNRPLVERQRPSATDLGAGPVSTQKNPSIMRPEDKKSHEGSQAP
jgi:anti-sigma factor RsiW